MLRLTDVLEPASYSIAQSPGQGCRHNIHGGDDAGVLAGLWRFIRSLRVWRALGNHSVSVADLQLTHTPADELWPLRGHMFSCGFHPLQFHTDAEAYAYARDLSAFGTNQIELAHIHDPVEHKGSHLPTATLVNFSRMVASIPGMNASLWWSQSHLLASPGRRTCPTSSRRCRASTPCSSRGATAGSHSTTPSCPSPPPPRARTTRTSRSGSPCRR